MKSNRAGSLTSTAAIVIALFFLAASTGCRGGLCNSCGGGYNYGYAPQQPGCGCGTGYQQGGYAQPGYVQPGYAQPGYVQPGVVAPQQIVPSQTQPGAIFNGQQ